VESVVEVMLSTVKPDIDVRGKTLDRDGSNMRIGELAAATGVSARSLRYYEEQGLLRSARSASGQRLYADDAVARVGTIQSLYAAGLNSVKIGELLPCLDAEPQERTSYLLDSLRAERVRIDGSLAELRRVRDTLDQVIASLASEQPRVGSAAGAAGAGRVR
jgi:DNA-binding transcriptional MerR regulator